MVYCHFVSCGVYQNIGECKKGACHTFLFIVTKLCSLLPPLPLLSPFPMTIKAAIPYSLPFINCKHKHAWLNIPRSHLCNPSPRESHPFPSICWGHARYPPTQLLAVPPRPNRLLQRCAQEPVLLPRLRQELQGGMPGGGEGRCQGVRDGVR